MFAPAEATSFDSLQASSAWPVAHSGSANSLQIHVAQHESDDPGGDAAKAQQKQRRQIGGEEQRFFMVGIFRSACLRQNGTGAGNEERTTRPADRSGSNRSRKWPPLRLLFQLVLRHDCAEQFAHLDRPTA